MNKLISDSYDTYQGASGWYKPCMPRSVERSKSKGNCHIVIVVLFRRSREW